MVKRTGACILALIFFLLPLLRAGRAEADMVNGSLELDYSALESTSTDAGRPAVREQAHNFTQQYTLNLNLLPFSTMQTAGGLNVTKTEGSGSSTTTVQPYLDVRLQDPFNIYSAGVGYRQLKTTSREGGGASQTLVYDQYNAYLGWLPFELPSINIQATRSNTYDADRLLEDSTTDTILFNTRYVAGRLWDVTALVSYTDSLQRLNLLETTALMESVGVNYRDMFWKRVSLSAGYNISLSTTRTTQQGMGVVPFQIYPFSGYSATTDFPDPTDNLAASPNAALIDGNRSASAGINIGTSGSLPPDNKFREMGVDFGTATEVNSVQVWISQLLTSAIANSFSWNVYASDDNVTWTFLQTSQPAAFGPFESQFSIGFKNVTTRFLKVAVRPLSLAVPGATDPTYQNIYVTEMTAFLNRQAEDVRGKSSQLSQQLNMSTGTRIAEGVSHVLAYNIYESTTTAGGREATTRYYALSNGLNLSRPFPIGPTVTASARFNRNDSFDSNGNRRGLYSYGAGLSAVPLKTLRGSLQYSGSLVDDGSKSDSLSLSSTADLYPGVSVSAMAGLNASEAGESNAKTRGNSVRASAGLAPHRSLSLSFNYASSRSATNADGRVSIGSSELWDAGTSYRPFETLYLTAALSRFRGADRAPTTLHSYGLNWSPFSGGTLQFSFSYTESYESNSDALQRTIGPALTWALAPRASITVSYYVATTSTPQRENEVKSLFGQYRMTF